MHGSARPRSFAFCAISAAACVALPAPLALAQEDSLGAESDACFTAAERAQPLMREKRLREARAELEICARDVCPRVARTDCRNWLADVTSEQPTIVIAPHEVRGTAVHDVHGIRAIVDGAILAENADTAPMAIDPGRHRLHLERPGADPLEQDIDIREGEKGRVVHVYWRGPGPVPMPSFARETPPAVYLLGTLGVGAAAVGTYFEIAGLSRRADLNGSCQATRTCVQSDVNAARDLTRVGDVTIGAGVLLLLSAGYLYLTRPVVSTSSRTRQTRWALSASPAGWAFDLRGTF
jgi:hypothetical protein